MSVADNYRKIRDSIDEQADKCGRQPKDIELIAVTKYVDTERIAQAIEAGAVSVGENKVQEYLEKRDFFKEKAVNADIIGRLQTNKVKYIAGDVRLIQSIDSIKLAGEVDKQAQKKQTVQDVLIEVNIGNEEQKGGISPDMLKDFLFEVSAMQGVCVKGLMCIPPAVSESDAEKFFEAMRRLYDDIASARIDNITMQHLSMGMSGDYMAAVRQGATMVRVGSAIFGARY